MRSEIFLLCIVVAVGCGGDDGDMDEDAGGSCAAIEVSTTRPLVEGQGALLTGVANGVANLDELISAPRLVAVTGEGCDFGTGLQVVSASGAFEQVGDAVTNGDLAVVSVRVPVDVDRADGLNVLPVTVIDGTQVLASAALQIEFLPELLNTTLTTSGRFSFVQTANGPNMPPAGAIVARSYSAALLGGPVNASAAGTAGGPGGGAGGLPGQAGGGTGGGGAATSMSACVGGGGGHALPGDDGTPPAVGGSAVNDATFLESLVLEGGGGGGGCIAGLDDGEGGGGGGVIDLFVDGWIAVTSSDPVATIDVGGGSGSGSGSALGGLGAGGGLLLRAAGLRGAIEFITDGAIGTGGNIGAPGRVRHDIDGQVSCAVGPGIDGTVCSAGLATSGGGSVHTGARMRPPAPPITRAPTATVVVNLGDATDVELEVDGAFDSSFSGTSHPISGPGLHRVCVINKALNGTVALENSAWRARAEHCIELALVP